MEEGAEKQRIKGSRLGQVTLHHIFAAVYPFYYSREVSLTDWRHAHSLQSGCVKFDVIMCVHMKYWHICRYVCIVYNFILLRPDQYYSHWFILLRTQNIKFKQTHSPRIILLRTDKFIRWLHKSAWFPPLENSSETWTVTTKLQRQNCVGGKRD
jgi:hypothetical protein